jgi:hypothetical protein
MNERGFVRWGSEEARPQRGQRTASSQMAVGPAGLLIAALIILGCSDEVSIAPPIDIPFTIYGIISPKADTQAVIVYPVQQGTLRPIGPEALDATVTSTELESGRTIAWQDSIVSEGSAGYSHVFWSGFRAEKGRSYRIDVTRSDGAASFADVRIPDVIEIKEEDDGTPWLKVTFRGEQFGVPRLELTYGVEVEDILKATCQLPHARFHYTFSDAAEVTRSDGGWDLAVDLRRVYRELLHIIREDSDGTWAESLRIALYSLRVDVLVADEAWILPNAMLEVRFPRLVGGMDWTLLAHPEMLTNVENGLGFVGAGYREDRLLFPSREALERTSFIDCLSRPQR